MYIYEALSDIFCKDKDFQCKYLDKISYDSFQQNYKQSLISNSLWQCVQMILLKHENNIINANIQVCHNFIKLNEDDGHLHPITVLQKSLHSTTGNYEWRNHYYPDFISKTPTDLDTKLFKSKFSSSQKSKIMS